MNEAERSKPIVGSVRALRNNWRAWKEAFESMMLAGPSS